MAFLFDELDAQRWLWWGRAAAKGNGTHSWQTLRRKSTISVKDTVIAIGRALQGHVDLEQRSMFGCFEFDFELDYASDMAKLAINFYNLQVVAARQAVDAWTLISLRFHLAKDIRIMIGKGKMIWSARDSANCKVDIR
jgi:hypothetical protein